MAFKKYIPPSLKSKPGRLVISKARAPGMLGPQPFFQSAPSMNSDSLMEAAAEEERQRLGLDDEGGSPGRGPAPLSEWQAFFHSGAWGDEKGPGLPDLTPERAEELAQAAFADQQRGGLGIPRSGINPGGVYRVLNPAEYAQLQEKMRQMEADRPSSGEQFVSTLAGALSDPYFMFPAMVISGGIAGAGAGAQSVIPAMVAGAARGAFLSYASGGNIFSGAIKGAAASGAGSYAGSVAGEFTADMTSSPLYAAAVEGGTRAATQAAVAGGDTDDILKAAATGAADALASAPSAGESLEPAYDYTAEGMLPADEPFVQALGGPLASPESVSSFLGSVPEAVSGTTLPIGDAELDITAPGSVAAAIAAGNLIAPKAALVGPDLTASAQDGEVHAPSKQSSDVQQAAQAIKIAKLLSALLNERGKGSVPEFPPQGSMSNEEYTQAAVEYLSLDPEDMREAGLEPGTPEYVDYILEQADSIIEQIFGADPSALLEGESIEDLQAALKDLTEQEAQQLTRALYVRGALGQMSFQSSSTDPFTGISEELGLLSGEQVEGAKAAHQRGIARSVESVAGLRGKEARAALGGMLGRKADLFNLQSSADARKLQAQLMELMDEEERKRRGITSAGDVPLEDESFFKDVLENADPRALERLLEQMGSRDRQGAAVEQLFGRRR